MEVGVCDLTTNQKQGYLYHCSGLSLRVIAIILMLKTKLSKHKLGLSVRLFSILF